MSISHITTSTEPRRNLYADTLTATTFNIGTITTTGDAEVGGNLQVDGKSEFKGDVKTDGKLLLPTTGGTASDLNFYEEYSFSPNFSGMWGAPKVCNILVRRV